MKSQKADLSYGALREVINQPRIERHLGCKVEKLGTYDIMDWKEINTDDDIPWVIEQKARNVTYNFCKENYTSPSGIPSALIGKNKLDYMLAHGCGIIYFDFLDKLMYWVFDSNEYKSFEVQRNFLRGGRSDFIDKPHDVVHIPCSILKECEVS